MKTKATLKSTVSEKFLAPKVVLGKSEPNISAVETASKNLDKSSKVASRRITIDVPMELYPKLKTHVFQQATTLKEYILGLVEKDLGI